MGRERDGLELARYLADVLGGRCLYMRAPLIAVRIDGCTWFGVYWRVILPQLGPAMVTLGILVFAGSWNSFFWPLVATRGQELRVTQLSLALLASDIFSAGIFGWVGVLAVATVLVLPPAILFLLLQCYYVRGIALTGFR